MVPPERRNVDGISRLEIGNEGRRLRFAKGIGASILITNSATPDAEDRFRRTLEAALPLCETLDVRIALENPGGGPSLIRDAATGVALVRAIGSPLVRLNYDVGNVYTASEERLDPNADVDAALPMMAHAHLKDVLSDPSGWRFVAIGAGSLRLTELARRLAEAGIPVGLELPLRLSRPGRGDAVRAAQRLPQVELQIGYLKKLPPKYVGERHVVTFGRLADGKYHWEERPGPAPANEDDGGRTILRIIPVAAKDGRVGS